MIVVLMGVSGSGKSTVGRALAGRVGWRFVDADDLHPAANVEKMRRGVPLTDEDRGPWLEAVAREIDAAASRGEDLVLACSALKHTYQEYLRHDLPGLVYVCLTGPEEVIAGRLARRAGHFAGPGLLPSQIAAFEPPEDAVVVDVRESVEEIVGEIRARLGI